MLVASIAVAASVAHPLLPAPAAVRPIPQPWQSLADCESGLWDEHGQPIDGTALWDIEDGPHEGGLQFHPDTWDGFRPGHFPESAAQASPHEQVAVARDVQAVQGWRAWPVCSVRVGLREAA